MSFDESVGRRRDLIRRERSSAADEARSALYARQKAERDHAVAQEEGRRLVLEAVTYLRRAKVRPTRLFVVHPGSFRGGPRAASRWAWPLSEGLLLTDERTPEVIRRSRADYRDPRRPNRPLPSAFRHMARVDRADARTTWYENGNHLTMGPSDISYPNNRWQHYKLRGVTAARPYIYGDCWTEGHSIDHWTHHPISVPLDEWLAAEVAIIAER